MIGQQPYTEMLFWQFSSIIIDVNIVGKILNQHLNVLLFSNPRDKVNKMKNYGTNLSRTFNKNLDLVPWIGEEPFNQMLI